MTIELSEDVIEAIADAVIKKMQQPCENMGEVSDGHHTFNQLYHQRAVLFATIVNEHPEISWKSFKHSDGHYCFDEDGAMFIVGVDTPEGSYTYHYHKKYWDLFKCKELEYGKKWDGHTEKDVTRLLSLPSVTPIRPKGEWIDFAVEPEKIFNQHYYACPHCDHGATYFVGGTENWWCTETPNFCPYCGADMRGENNAE